MQVNRRDGKQPANRADTHPDPCLWRRKAEQKLDALIACERGTHAPLSTEHLPCALVGHHRMEVMSKVFPLTCTCSADTVRIAFTPPIRGYALDTKTRELQTMHGEC